MKFLSIAALGLMLQGSAAIAAGTDIVVAPSSGGGHDLNHSPVGQTFVAVAPAVRAGLYVMDQSAAALAGSYPYPVRAFVDLKLELLAGAGVPGSLLHSEVRTVVAPFSGFLDVDYEAAGIRLQPGQTYTLLATDLTPANGAPTGWTFPSEIDATQPPVNGLQPGAYAEGQPILQGRLVVDDAGIGDNAFRVIGKSDCGVPAGAKSAEGEGLVTGVTADRLWLLLRDIRLGECVRIKWQRKQQQFRIGDRIEFKGYRVGNQIIATDIEVRRLLF